MGADPLSNYKAGLHNVGSYQVSGVPWITGSKSLLPGDQVKYIFPMVAGSVTVINHSPAATGSLRVHFAASASGRVIDGYHYVELDSNEDSISMNVKCKEIYISCPSTNSGLAEYRVIAELTQIDVARMFALTGSGVTD